MKYISLSCLILLIMLFAGCDRFSSKPGEVAFADIADAYYLAVTDSDPSLGEENNLLKIVTSNLESDPVSVDFLNENGDILGPEFASVYVCSVIPISPDYSVLWGEFIFTLKGGETHSNGLLLNVKTGALYDLAYEYMPYPYNTYMASRYHQQDRYGRIYFHGQGIKRFHFDSPSAVSVEHYVDYPVGDDSDYYVDPEGNVYFNRGAKVKQVIGGIAETGTQLICFTGMDGTVYGFQNDTSKVLYLYELVVDPEGFSKEIILQSNVYFESIPHDICYYADSAANIHLFVSHQTIWKSDQEIDYNHTGIGYEASAEALYTLKFPLDIPDISEKLGMEENYVWYWDYEDRTKLYAVNLEHYSMDPATGYITFSDHSEFQIPSSLEIQQLWFNEDRIIQFRGYDLAREVYVTGYVSVAQGLQHFDEESSLGSVTLTRIR